MSYLDNRQSAELNYDGAEPYDEPPPPPDEHWTPTRLVQDPDDPNHWSYTSPAPPLTHISVTRGMKATYGWHIAVEGLSDGVLVDRLVAIDDALRVRFRQEEPGTTPRLPQERLLLGLDGGWVLYCDTHANVPLHTTKRPAHDVACPACLADQQAREA